MDEEAYRCYSNTYIQMLESGHFLFGAHLDLFGASVDTWERLGKPLEINVSGWLKQEQNANKLGFPSAEEAAAAGHTCPRPYPQDDFWRIAAKHHIQAVVNSDAHDPEVLTRYMELGYDMARCHGIEVIYPFGK